MPNSNVPKSKQPNKKEDRIRIQRVEVIFENSLSTSSGVYEPKLN
jgi:hypothetical protein